MIQTLEEFEIVLNGIERDYQENKSHYSADNKKYQNLYRKVWLEAMKLNDQYFFNSGFGFGDIDKIDNRF